MSRRRGRRRRHVGALWLIAIGLAAIWQLPVAARWLLIAPAGCMLVAVPLAFKGGVSALPQLLTTRQGRIARRRPWTDPRTGQEVRPARPAIPRWLLRATYAADRYRCVYCGKRPPAVTLQWDHIIPWDFGGLTSLWNGATLCKTCNGIKSNYWKSDSGKIYYGRWGHNMGLAGEILRAELRARHNPLRWVRAGCTWWVR